MRRWWIILVVAASLWGRQKNQQPPKPLPLPPQPPMALAAGTQMLDFRISPLLAKGGLGEQIQKSLEGLIRDTHGQMIVKLRGFVAGAGDPRLVEEKAAQMFTDHKLPLPVVSIVQVGALANGAAEVVIEAVAEGKQALNPNGLAFFSGQSGSSIGQAVQQLAASAKAASVSAGQILRCTCFVSYLPSDGSMQAVAKKAFPQALVNVVQPLREPGDGSAMCEAVGRLTRNPHNGVEVLPNARVALVDSPQLIFTGLQLSFGNYLNDAHEAFERLQQAASAVLPVEAPVEMNAFALDGYAASALLETHAAPAATFTVQTVEGLPAIDASAGIEAIFVPLPHARVPVGR